MQRLHERSAKGIFIHDTVIRMHLVHRQYYRTSCTDLGYPLVVMVEPTHYRNSDHLSLHPEEEGADLRRSGTCC